MTQTRKQKLRSMRGHLTTHLMIDYELLAPHFNRGWETFREVTLNKFDELWPEETK